MRVRPLAWAVFVGAGAVTGITGTGPAFGAVGSALAAPVYDCASVDFNPVTSETTGHRCSRGGNSPPDVTGYVLFDQALDEEYACDNITTSPDPDGGLTISGTTCERVVAS
jgi:hypothetical protein